MKNYFEDPKVTAFALGELRGPEAEELKRLMEDDDEFKNYVTQIRTLGKSLSETLKKEELVPLKLSFREKLHEVPNRKKFFNSTWILFSSGIAVAGLAFVITTQNLPHILEHPKTTPEFEIPVDKIVKENPEVPLESTPPPKVVKMEDKTREAVSKSPKKEVAEKAKNSKAGQASEVRPIPDSKNKPKKFTSSVAKGGAVKQGETMGANAQSKDVTKTGLLAAFGGGGMRKNLDKAYNGSGELLGMAEKANGSAGFNENRAGDDIGGKFKNTGAGGKGTATQGIAGIGTKGRGIGDGLGDKNSVAIEPGGAEEEFTGTIDREAVRRVIRAGLREIRSCYEKEAIKNIRLRRIDGKVVVTWTIGEHGRSLKTKVDSSTLKNKSIENCVRDRFSLWIFPEPPSGITVDVKYPIYFRSEN